MDEEILPFDFGWRLLIETVNAIPVSAQFFVRKRYDVGCKSVTMDLLGNRRLRDIADELINARGVKIDDRITVRANNRQELENTIDQELTHRFINLMHVSHDAYCDEARSILLDTLAPYLDAAEMLELTREIWL